MRTTPIQAFRLPNDHTKRIFYLDILSYFWSHYLGTFFLLTISFINNSVFVFEFLISKLKRFIAQIATRRDKKLSSQDTQQGGFKFS